MEEDKKLKIACNFSIVRTEDEQGYKWSFFGIRDYANYEVQFSGEKNFKKINPLEEYRKKPLIIKISLH